MLAGWQSLYRGLAAPDTDSLIDVIIHVVVIKALGLMRLAAG